MIGYRFLPLAEEEMTEASLFYETARTGFGDIFLDDVQRALDAIRERPEIGANIAYGFRRVLLRRFTIQRHLLDRSRRSRGGGCGPSETTPQLLDQAHMTANSSWERTVIHRGRTVLRR